jgi:hypothetical protein
MNAYFLGRVTGFTIIWIIYEAISLAVHGKSNGFSPLSTRDLLVIGIFVKLLQVEESLKRRD